MLTPRGRLVFVVTIMLAVFGLSFVGLARSSKDLRPNIKSYVESQHGRR